MIGRAIRWALLAIAVLIAWPTAPARAQIELFDAAFADLDLEKEFEAHHAAKRYQQAFDVGKRLVASRESRLGANHPLTAKAVGNMALELINVGRIAEAEAPLKRALAVFEATQSADSELVVRSATALARVYTELNRGAEAEAMLKRALAIKERTLGRDHADVVELLSKLAGAAIAAGRNSEAEAYFARMRPEQARLSRYTVYKGHASKATAEGRWAEVVNDMRQVERFAVEDYHATRKKALDSSYLATPGLEGDWWLLIKAAHRLSEGGGAGVEALASEMFEAVQWLNTSAASSSVAQMAVRARVGDTRLAALLRERQDLASEWRGRKNQLNVAEAHRIVPELLPLATNAMDYRINEMAMRARVEAIEKRVAELERQLAKEFPSQTAEADLSPIPVHDVQAILGPSEALVLFLSTSKVEELPPETFVWIVTASGVRWLKTPLDSVEIAALTNTLQCGLYAVMAAGPTCKELTGIDFTADDERADKALPFALAAAHELYKALLAPAADIVEGKQLIVVPSKDLASLPLHVLLTEASGWRGQLYEWRGRLSSGWLTRWLPSPPDFGWVARRLPNWSKDFDWLTRRLPNWSLDLGWRRWWYGYTNAAMADSPWLIRKHALSVMPSVLSLVVLRRQARPSAAREPFLGYGNPTLAGAPGCQMPAVPDRCPEEQARGNTRGVRHSVAIPTDDEETEIFFATGRVNRERLRKLCPLPDTALELACVAKSVGASAKSIFIGPAMTETALKKAPLDRYRVIHFATHGLREIEVFRFVAPGRRQSALVMTPPATETDEDDGLLTPEEIAALKLDADWVVLSACNTAGGGGSLDGLVSAFFYAGARAVLASYWPVNSEAATMLTTGTFEVLKREPAIGRAEAFRRAMLVVMDDRKRPWAAHPSYWAPFVVMGEGGVGR